MIWQAELKVLATKIGSFRQGFKMAFTVIISPEMLRSWTVNDSTVRL